MQQHVFAIERALSYAEHISLNIFELERSAAARNTEKHLVWLNVLEPVVACALSDSGDNPGFRARAITLAALACLDASSAEWVVRDGAVDYGDLLDETFALLKPSTLSH